MPILVTTEVQIARFANALYGIKLGSNTNTAVEEDVTNLGLAATVNAYYNYSFGSKTSAEVANIILGNVGLAGNAAAEAFIIGQLNAAGTAKGQAVLGMLNAFANLTSDATFGAAATAWNTTIASALVYTASNPEDVAATATTTQTYVLTDAVEVVVRTAGDDIIMAPAGSMQTFDVTDGGAGFDTLVIEGVTGRDTPVGKFTNIEKVILSAFDSNDLDNVKANEFQGVQQIWFENTEDNEDITVEKLTNGITVGLKATNEMRDFELQYTDASTSSNITLDGLKGQVTVNVKGKAISAVNLSGSVAVDPATGLPLGDVHIDITDESTKLTTINVTTSSTISFETPDLERVTKIDASQSTGNVFAEIRLNDVNNSASYGVNYLGASGNDFVEAHLEDLDAKDVLKGNAGYDTFKFLIRYEDNSVDAGDDLFDENYQTTWEGDYAPTTAQYALINKVEFEQISFDAWGEAGHLILDAAKLTANNIGTEQETVFLNLENSDTVYYTYTDDESVNLDLLAKRDDISPTKYAAGAGTVNLVAVTKGSTVDVSPNMKQAGELGGEDFSDFSKLVVTGAGDVDMHNIYGFGVEIDASGLKGSLDIELAYDAVDKITLGAGKDEVHLFHGDVSDASDEDGDFFDALSDYGNMDTITGFTSGQDKFKVNDFNYTGPEDSIKYLAYTGDLGVDFSQTVSLALMAAKDAGADVASFVWSGNTYVVQDVFTYTWNGSAVEAVVDWTGDFEPADDMVVKLTGVVTLVKTDFEYYDSVPV